MRLIAQHASWMMIFLLSFWSFPSSGMQGPETNDEGVVDVFFVDSIHGWVLGGPAHQHRLLLSTADGGATWSKLGVHDGFMQVSFIGARLGWATAVEWPDPDAERPRTLLYRTNDGGHTWSKCSILAEPSDSTIFPYFRFADAKHGWFIGEGPGGAGILLTTSDGGQSVHQVKDLPENADWRSIYSQGEERLWLFGNDTILRSSNGGRSWTMQMDPTHIPGGRSSLAISAGVIRRDGMGWVVGEEYILATRDYGKSWTVVFESPYGYFNDISFSDRLHGCAVTGAAEVFCTSDGGKKWSEAHPPLKPGSRQMVPWEIHAIPTKIVFSSAHTVWLLSHYRALFRSDNAGADWTEVKPFAQTTTAIETAK